MADFEIITIGASFISFHLIRKSFLLFIAKACQKNFHLTTILFNFYFCHNNLEELKEEDINYNFALYPVFIGPINCEKLMFKNKYNSIPMNQLPEVSYNIPVY